MAVSKLMVDQGNEYCSRSQRSFYTTKGLEIEPTVAYELQQNGVEVNRTLVEKIRTMLIDSKVPKSLWVDAVLAGVYIMEPYCCAPTESDPCGILVQGKAFIGKVKNLRLLSVRVDT